MANMPTLDYNVGTGSEAQTVSDKQLVLSLPEELIEQAEAAQLDIQTVLVEALREEIQRTQAVEKLFVAIDQLQGTLTPEEVEAELRAAKEERIAAAQAKQNGKL